MFGYGSRIRNLRNEFDETRKRVLFGMNPYQQYGFGSVFEHVPDELMTPFETIADDDSVAWLNHSKTLKAAAQEGYKFQESLGGIAAEGGTAGAEGVYLLSVLSAAKAYQTPESILLQCDIQRFIHAVSEFMEKHENAGRERLPHCI